MSKIAYFDCFSGISGDMIIGALIDAGVDFSMLKSELTKLPLADYELHIQRVSKQHIAATKFDVVDNGKAAYRHLKDLNAIVDDSQLPSDIQQKAKNIFLRIANAEAKVHGQPVEKVHFHEIGAVDTIIDVVGALIGLKMLNIERVLCSRLNVGSGFVEFSHGKFPVPAPATAEILKNIPVYATDTQAELVTPTGAAIITEFAHAFGDLPGITPECIGYGAGGRELPHPNVLRIFVGEQDQTSAMDRDMVSVIETNIDDMNPQLYESVIDKLFEKGALDVYLTNIMMKKSRPGIKLTVLANLSDESKLAKLIFQETTSIGVRIRQEARKKLQREIKEIETRFGKVNFKITKLGGQIVNSTPEYEDCKRIAAQKKIPLKQVCQWLSKITIEY